MKKFLPVLVAIFFLACGSATAPHGTAAQPPASDPPAAPPRLPNDVHWTRDSAEHRAILVQTYRLAGKHLELLAAGHRPGTWAVALDADETVLDNSLYQKELVLAGAGFSRESWAAWVARREAPPLPGAVAFLERAHRLGGKIAIVTNRDEELCADTEANFRAYAIPYDVILCRREGRSEKETRWQRIEEGSASPELPPLTILLWLGDNIGDFPGGDQELRHADEPALEEFGRRFFVLPNPMYGSWRDNPPE